MEEASVRNAGGQGLRQANGKKAKILSATHVRVKDTVLHAEGRVEVSVVVVTVQAIGIRVYPIVFVVFRYCLLGCYAAQYSVMCPERSSSAGWSRFLGSRYSVLSEE